MPSQTSSQRLATAAVGLAATAYVIARLLRRRRTARSNAGGHRSSARAGGATAQLLRAVAARVAAGRRAAGFADVVAAAAAQADLLQVRSVRLTITARDGYALAAKICEPASGAPPPVAAAVFAHGGCFHDGDLESQHAVVAALASVGVASVSSSYRQGGAHPHPAAQRDLEDVAAFVRERWPSLPFGVVGSSSGGWHALHLARALAEVRFCVALCPVADPAARAAYLRACVAGTAPAEGYACWHAADAARAMLGKQTAYWRSEEAMRTAGEGVATPHAVPTLMVLGSADKNVPLRVTAAVQGWAHRTLVLGGLGHEVQGGPAADAEAGGGRGGGGKGGGDSWLPDVERFVRRSVR